MWDCQAHETSLMTLTAAGRIRCSWNLYNNLPEKLYNYTSRRFHEITWTEKFWASSEDRGFFRSKLTNSTAKSGGFEKIELKTGGASK